MCKKFLSVVLVAIFILSAGLVAVVATGNDLPILPGVENKQGDVNLDAKVNIKDATLIQKHLAKITEVLDFQLQLADVDGKEGVNIKDATHLQKWIAGLVDELFAPDKKTEPVTTATASQDASVAGTSVVLTEPETSENTQPSAEKTEPGSSVVVTDPTESPQPSSSAVVTDPTEAPQPSSSAVVTDPTEAPQPSSSAVVTDPTEAPQPSSSAVVTDPTETTEATKATEATRDPNKPIELPFVPAS